MLQLRQYQLGMPYLSAPMARFLRSFHPFRAPLYRLPSRACPLAHLLLVCPSASAGVGVPPVGRARAAGRPLHLTLRPGAQRRWVACTAHRTQRGAHQARPQRQRRLCDLHCGCVGHFGASSGEGHRSSRFRRHGRLIELCRSPLVSHVFLTLPLPFPLPAQCWRRRSCSTCCTCAAGPSCCPTS